MCEDRQRNDDSPYCVINQVSQVCPVEEVESVLAQFLHPGIHREVQQAEWAGQVLEETIILQLEVHFNVT